MSSKHQVVLILLQITCKIHKFSEIFQNLLSKLMLLYQKFQPSRFSRNHPIFRDRFRPPVYCFLPKSQICYTYSLKSIKNSTSNGSLLKQLKKPERIVKIQDRLHSLRTLQMTKRDRNVVENSSCCAKTSHILRQKAADPPLGTKFTRTCTTPRYNHLFVSEGWNFCYTTVPASIFGS